MIQKYLAFDVETARAIPEGISDWRSCRPLGISCAAALLADTKELVLWESEFPSLQLTQQAAKKVVYDLTRLVERGYTIVTWNGLGFDFDVLAEESGMVDECRRLATHHVDLMFHVLCKLGFGVRLDAAAQGMGLVGKQISGADTPRLWAEGKREEVLPYVGTCRGHHA
jgi:hypothetical protein